MLVRLHFSKARGSTTGFHPCRPAGTVDAISASEERRSSIERLSRARSRMEEAGRYRTGCFGRSIC